LILAFTGLGLEIAYAIKGKWVSHTPGMGANDYSALKELGVHPIFPVLGMGYVGMKILTCGLSVTVRNALNKGA